jgi:hypothetical protein
MRGSGFDVFVIRALRIIEYGAIFDRKITLVFLHRADQHIARQAEEIFD